MKRRITTISMVLNLVLLGAILFVLRKPVENTPAKRVQIIPHAPVPPVAEAMAQTDFVPQASKPFDWSQVEAEDFVAYAFNLRGIGCPEETVRDILTAEINDLFVHRRQEMLRPFQSQFWDRLSRGGNRLFPEEMEEAQDALDEEKTALLKSIVGAAPSKRNDTPQTEYERLLGDGLSPEKIQRLKKTTEKFNRLSKEIIESNDLPEPERGKKRAELRRQRDAEEKSILSSEDLEEFRLLKSDFRENLHNLHGFQASEEELRAMARLKLDEPESADDDIKKLLGEKRFADFQRSRDADFQNLSRIGRRYGLSANVIAETYDFAHAIRYEVRAVRDNPEFSDEERELAFDYIRERGRREMISNLGERAAETYRRIGDGLDEIGNP